MSATTLRGAKRAATEREYFRIYAGGFQPRDIECWWGSVLWIRKCWRAPDGHFGWSRWTGTWTDEQAKAQADTDLLDTCLARHAHNIEKLRRAIAARAALRDTDADRTDEERARFAERATADQDIDDDALSRLSFLLTDSGLSIVEFARLLGRDERTVRRWLSREMPIPGAVSAMLHRVQRIDVTPKKITIILER